MLVAKWIAALQQLQKVFIVAVTIIINELILAFELQLHTYTHTQPLSAVNMLTLGVSRNRSVNYFVVATFQVSSKQYMRYIYIYIFTYA